MAACNDGPVPSQAPRTSNEPRQTPRIPPPWVDGPGPISSSTSLNPPSASTANLARVLPNAISPLPPAYTPPCLNVNRATSTNPDRPPPGASELAILPTLPRSQTRSNRPRPLRSLSSSRLRSEIYKVPYSFHPSLTNLSERGSVWTSAWIWRVPRYWGLCGKSSRCERLDETWPVCFVDLSSRFGLRRMAERRRSESGVSMEPPLDNGRVRIPNSDSVELSPMQRPPADSTIIPPPPSSATHPLLPTYTSNLSHLSTLISSHLSTTRLVLSLVEMVDLIILVLLFVGLGVAGAKQQGLLQAAEAALVVAFLGNVAAFYYARVQRYNLSGRLRTLSLDWSPLPVTSPSPFSVSPSPSSSPFHFRWTLTKTEGGWWTGYRPVVVVEMIVSGGQRPGRTGGGRGDDVREGEDGEDEEEGEDYVPVYVKDVVDDKIADASGGGAVGVGGGWGSDDGAVGSREMRGGGGVRSGTETETV